MHANVAGRAGSGEFVPYLGADSLESTTPRSRVSFQTPGATTLGHSNLLIILN